MAFTSFRRATAVSLGTALAWQWLVSSAGRDNVLACSHYLHTRSMLDWIPFGGWDWALVLAVTLQASCIAYISQPVWKAYVLALPIPFSLAFLAVGQPMDATNASGLVLLLVFITAVQILYQRLKLPIVPAIAASALGYVGLGVFLAPRIPRSNAAFWVVAGCIWGLGLFLYFKLRFRREKAHRTPLPVPIKVPIIAGVVICLLLLKTHLRGFVTVFPMVTVVACYEARHSLYTLSRQIPTVILVMVPVMATIRLLQDSLGLGGSLAVAWLVYGAMIIPLNRYMNREARVPAETAPQTAAGS